MKMLLLFLLVLAGCGSEYTPADLLNSPDATEVVPTAEKIVARPQGLAAAKQRAHRLLHRAAQNARTAPERGVYQKVDAALAGARVDVPPPGRDLKACVKEAEVLAFVNLLIPNVIHVCARAAEADTRHLSQVLIHEAAHVAGVHDECAATKVEVGTIRRAGESIAFRNGYMQRCGIR